MIDHSKRDWIDDAVENGWVMPSVAWWKRAPIIRHIRHGYHMIQAQRFRKMTRAMGLGVGGLPQYDSWVLYGMVKGWEGVK